MSVGVGVVVDVLKKIVLVGIEVICVGDNIGTTDEISATAGIEFWESSTKISSSVDTGIMLVEVATGT